MKKLTAVSLFSGCGGFDLGIKRHGVKILWANDIDAHAATAYKSIHSKTEFFNQDIKSINELPTADILIGCYPCTGFSLGARRRWKENPTRNLHENDKNFLFQEFLRACDLVKPKLIFIENVRGMLSADKGYFLEQQLNGFKSKGFENVQVQLLNAADYGVPQTRHRAFFVGFHKSLGDVPYTFPAREFGKGAGNNWKSLMSAIGDMHEWPEGEFYDGVFHGHFLTRNRKRMWHEPSYTIVADSHHVPLHPLGEAMSFVSKDKWRLNGKLNRRLSWRECARIQGLPDTIDIHGTLSDKYRVIGNSVPPDLAEFVSKDAIIALKKLMA